MIVIKILFFLVLWLIAIIIIAALVSINRGEDE